MAMAAERLDRISTLPDETLCHILYFLPTKVAVRTSVLSKRWKTLWLSVPTLDFDESDPIYGGIHRQPDFRLLQLVYAVMLRRPVAQPIKRFCLSCYSSICHFSNVNVWVNAAVQRGVEHLDLTLHTGINLPSCILSCATLVVLKLTRLTVNNVLSVSLPSLKTLHLNEVRFKEHRYYMKLLFGSSVLEDLGMISVRVDNFIADENEIQSLHKLVRANIVRSRNYISLNWICNVEFLRLGEFVPKHNDIPAFNNLIHVELVFGAYNWDWFAEALKRCYKLRILVIIKEDIPSSIGTNWTNLRFVPECLSSHLKTLSFIGYRGLECELQFVRYILQNARVLRTMKICSPTSTNVLAKFDMMKKLSLCPRSSPTCELSFD